LSSPFGPCSPLCPLFSVVLGERETPSKDRTGSWPCRPGGREEAPWSRGAQRRRGENSQRWSGALRTAWSATATLSTSRWARRRPSSPAGARSRRASSAPRRLCPGGWRPPSPIQLGRISASIRRQPASSQARRTSTCSRSLRKIMPASRGMTAADAKRLDRENLWSRVLSLL